MAMDHLGFAQWPFSIVPRPEHCTFIAGRDHLRRDITRLLQALSRRDTSSIQVLWSWFGAGKTHALYYLDHTARMLNDDSGNVRLIPAYTEFPKSASGFIDLYRAIVSRVDLEQVVDAYLEVTTARRGESVLTELQRVSPDLDTALRAMAIDDGAKRSTATRWLRADPVPLSEFRQVGIAQRIASTDCATQVLSLVVQLLAEAARSRGSAGARIVWLIDEFQRIQPLGKRRLVDINAGLHSLFNAAPVGLTIVVSFSGAPKERTLPDWFSQELRDRIGTTRVMVLPPLQPDQALTFVRELLDHFRPAGVEFPSAYFPFTRSCCQAIIEHLMEKAALQPRTLIHGFNAVLEEADPLLESGDLREVTLEFAKKVLGQYVTVSQAPAENGV